MSIRIILSVAAWLLSGTALSAGWAAVGTCRTRWATTTGFDPNSGDDPRAIPQLTRRRHLHAA